METSKVYKIIGQM